MHRDQIKKFYAGKMEKDRLDMNLFKLEGIRTKEIITRYLSRPTLDILDIGGGAGFYSFWLQESGHNVSLIDLSPVNIELANKYSKQHGILLKSCEVGDATHLNFPNDHFDIVLLLGPLYHLIEKKERINALTEAKRVLKPHGILLAAVISRYASLLDGLKRDLITDEQFEKILLRDLETGIHINDTDNPEYFTTAFFHTPDEIRNEIVETGLKFEKLVAIESAGWVIDDLIEKSKDELYMAGLQKIITRVESNDDLIAISPHIMAIARKN